MQQKNKTKQNKTKTKQNKTKQNNKTKQTTKTNKKNKAENKTKGGMYGKFQLTVVGFWVLATAAIGFKTKEKKRVYQIDHIVR